MINLFIENLKKMKMLSEKRIVKLNNNPDQHGKVIYWMSRDQRVYDNWALIAAQNYAVERDEKLEVVFCLTDRFLGATARQFGFMLNGLTELANKFTKLNIPFNFIKGNPSEQMSYFLKSNNCGAVFCEFDPLRIKQSWQKNIKSAIDIPMYEVDAHNIVPARFVSQKAEFAAYTIRPKIHKLFDEFLVDIPQPVFHIPNGEIDKSRNEIKFDLAKYDSIAGETGFLPGESAAQNVLNRFLEDKIQRYDEEGNNPLLDGQSNLSPYIHFGMISAQRCAYEVSKLPQNDSTKAFLEELVVRRELADNFVLYNEYYDSFLGIPLWAAATLDIHRADAREFVYSANEFESAVTHDPYWNAAQKEMTLYGKMHGYMRMYWAKKILEWSRSPEEAIETAVYLNDKYELDGRDPNGYAGIMWSIGGVHDRAWQERPVFGKIRYMNANGLKRKFDAEGYVKKILGTGGTLF